MGGTVENAQCKTVVKFEAEGHSVDWIRNFSLMNSFSATSSSYPLSSILPA